jgi:hypothetical protein
MDNTEQLAPEQIVAAREVLRQLARTIDAEKEDFEKACELNMDFAYVGMVLEQIAERIEGGATVAEAMAWAINGLHTAERAAPRS